VRLSRTTYPTFVNKEEQCSGDATEGADVTTDWGPILRETGIETFLESVFFSSSDTFPVASL
jgi:hypothetical protein